REVEPIRRRAGPERPGRVCGARSEHRTVALVHHAERRDHLGLERAHDGHLGRVGAVAELVDADRDAARSLRRGTSTRRRVAGHTGGEEEPAGATTAARAWATAPTKHRDRARPAPADRT